MECYLQQGGTTCHTSDACMRETESYFSDRLISKNLWPPRSPDLTPPDFFLCGLLKGHVYSNKPQTIDALKDIIQKEVVAITDVTLLDVFADLQTSIQKCLDAGRGHFQHVLQADLILQHTRQVHVNFHREPYKNQEVIEECLCFLVRELPCTTLG